MPLLATECRSTQEVKVETSVRGPTWRGPGKSAESSIVVGKALVTFTVLYVIGVVWAPMQASELTSNSTNPKNHCNGTPSCQHLTFRIFGRPIQGKLKRPTKKNLQWRQGQYLAATTKG